MNGFPRYNSTLRSCERLLLDTVALQKLARHSLAECRAFFVRRCDRGIPAGYVASALSPAKKEPSKKWGTASNGRRAGVAGEQSTGTCQACLSAWKRVVQKCLAQSKREGNRRVANKGMVLRSSRSFAGQRGGTRFTKAATSRSSKCSPLKNRPSVIRYPHHA